MNRWFPTLVALALTAPGILSFALNAYIGAVQPPDAQVALLVRVDGVLDGFVYLVAFAVLAAAVAVGRPLVFTSGFARYYVVVASSALAYFGGILVLTPFAGNALGYTIGDLYRAILPLLTIVVLFSIFPGNDEFRDRFIRIGIFVAFSFALIGGAWKTAYAAMGVFYGGGLLQYYVGSFVLSYVLLRIANGTYAPGRALAWSVVLTALIALSVMSLKRGIWIAIALVLSMTTLYSTRRARIVAFACALVAVFGALGHATGVNGIVVQRIMYTFSGPRTLDASSFERVSEGAGAVYTMAQKRVPMAFLTGLGHGAEFRAAPRFPMAAEEGGSASGLYHHIHSTPFLLLFRYGLVGVALYALLVLPVLHILVRMRSRRFRAFMARDWHGQVCMASMVGTLTTLVLGIQGNVVYGTTFGAGLFTLVASYLAAAHAYREAGVDHG